MKLIHKGIELFNNKKHGKYYLEYAPEPYSLLCKDIEGNVIKDITKSYSSDVVDIAIFTGVWVVVDKLPE